MQKPILFSSLLAFALAAYQPEVLAQGGDNAPRLFVQIMEPTLPPNFQQLLSDHHLCGGQLLLPWKPIDNGSGNYDWSSVEQAIQPWTSAGKAVGLAFRGVDETFRQEGAANTSALATPDYVMNQVHVVRCEPTTKFTGETKVVPPTPVYWEPGYAENWKRFIKAAIEKYQDDPRVSYLRFGIGAADESFPMSGAATSACMAEWNRAGMSYRTWLDYALSIIDYVGSLHPRVAIAFDVNKLGPWDERTGGHNAFPEAIAAEAIRYGFLVGNEGFTGTDPQWNELYRQWGRQTQLYMQTASVATQEHFGSDMFPSITRAAQQLGIQVYELYPREWEMAYDPRNKEYASHGSGIRAALEALPAPASCRVNPHWGAISETPRR